MVVGLVRSQPNAFKGKVVFAPPLQKIAEAFPEVKELLKESGPVQLVRDRLHEMISAMSNEDLEKLISEQGVAPKELEEMIAKPILLPRFPDGVYFRNRQSTWCARVE